MKRELVLFGVCLFFFSLIPFVDASECYYVDNQSLCLSVAPFLVQSSCEINWRDKFHKFETEKRWYSFKGEKLMKYDTSVSPDRPSFLYTSWVLFNVTAEYDPQTGDWTETAVVTIPRMKDRPSDRITSSTAQFVQTKTHTRTGKAASDPWIATGNQVPQVSVATDNVPDSGWIVGECFVNDAMHSFDRGISPCPAPWSSCAFTPAERATLQEEALSMGTCTPQMVKRPTITLGFDAGWQQSTGHFSSPGKVGIILTAPCNCSPPAADGWAYFFVEIEKETWDAGAYGFTWQPVKNLKADMGYSEAQKQVTAGVNLGLSEDGKYRVRAKSMMMLKIQAEEQVPPISESAFTDWVTITAGELKKDVLKPGAAAQRAQSVSAAAAAGTTVAETVQSQRPDLVVSEFTVSGGSPDDYTLNWRVENRGTAKAAPAHVDLCCRCLGGPCDCREVIVAGYDIQGDRCMRLGDTIELFPKPGGATGGGSRFQLYPVKLPQEGFRYVLTVKVDQDNQVDEGANEGNNQLVSYFPPLGQPLRKPVAAAAKPLAGQQNVPVLPSGQLVKPPSAGTAGTLAPGAVKPIGATAIQTPVAPIPGSIKPEAAGNIGAIKPIGATAIQTPVAPTPGSIKPEAAGSIGAIKPIGATAIQTPVTPTPGSIKPEAAGSIGAIKPIGATAIQTPVAPTPDSIKPGGATPVQAPAALKPRVVGSAGAILGSATCDINVTGPAVNQTCYVNGTCPVTWDTSKIKNYGSVFLHVVQTDAQHPQGWEGGGFPVANTGSYQWVVPENVGPLTGATYQIKVITSDQKCSGKSKSFNIGSRTLQQPAQKPRLLKR